MPTFSLATSLKNKLGGGSGRGGSPQPAEGSSPQPRVSFVDSAEPNETPESTGKLPQRDMDAALRASPACQRKSAAGEHELEDDEVEPSLDSVFARRISTHATRAHPWAAYRQLGSSGRSTPPRDGAGTLGLSHCFLCSSTLPTRRVLCSTTPLCHHPGWTTHRQRLYTPPSTCTGLRC